MNMTQTQQNQQVAPSQQMPQISTQIAVYKTGKKLIELLDKLNPAIPENYAHIHGAGDDGTGNKVYSLLGLVLLDYSNGTGENKVRVTANLSPEDLANLSPEDLANLSPEDLAYLYNQMQQGKETIDFNQDKIFGSIEGEPNGGIVTKVMIRRSSIGSDGKPRNYPWYVEVQNGTGIKAKAAAGGTYIQAGSYQIEKKVGINLNDLDMYKFIHKAMRYVEIWEMTYGTQLLKRAVQLKGQIQQ